MEFATTAEGVPAQPRQLDRGRHHRGHAEHPRRARARPARRRPRRPRSALEPSPPQLAVPMGLPWQPADCPQPLVRQRSAMRPDHFDAAVACRQEHGFGDASQAVPVRSRRPTNRAPIDSSAPSEPPMAMADRAPNWWIGDEHAGADCQGDLQQHGGLVGGRGVGDVDRHQVPHAGEHQHAERRPGEPGEGLGHRLGAPRGPPCAAPARRRPARTGRRPTPWRRGRAGTGGWWRRWGRACRTG